MTVHLSSKHLCRGDRFARALKSVNRRVLITPQQARLHSVRGDAEIAADCGLSTKPHHRGQGGVIQIPARSTLPPTGHDAYPDSGALYFMVQDLNDAARINCAPPPPVVGCMVKGDREVFLHSFDVRVQQQLLNINLAEAAEKVLPATALAGRIGVNGVFAGTMVARDCMRRGYPHAWRSDIQKFFPSTGTGQVLQALDRTFSVEDGFLRMVDWNLRAPILRAPNHPQVLTRKASGEQAPLHALYQGSVIAPVLSNIVAHEVLDKPFRTLLGGSALLLRYFDDLLVMARCRDSLEYAISAVDGLVSAAGWSLHPAKTTDALNLETDELDYLGYTIGRGSVRPSTTTINSLLDAMRAADPASPQQRGVFVQAALTFMPASMARVTEVCGLVSKYGSAHEAAFIGALNRVNQHHRARWIASAQRFLSPLNSNINNNQLVMSSP
jgi:hypothetical protein